MARIVPCLFPIVKTLSINLSTDCYNRNSHDILSTVNMTINNLSGVIVPVGTPLAGDDRVDVAALRRLTAYLVDAGVHTLFANGSMSGFAFLTDDEQLRAIDTVIQESAGRVAGMAGLGETSTSRAIPKAKAMARTGARYLSVLPPFYFFAQQEHLIAYFSAIASAVDIPIVLYDNPVLTKNPIHPETIVELRRRVPNIIAIKESNQDCVNLQRVLALTADDPGFSVLTGSEFLILVALQMGVHGCVGGLHNLCPTLRSSCMTPSGAAIWRPPARANRRSSRPGRSSPTARSGAHSTNPCAGWESANGRPARLI